MKNLKKVKYRKESVLDWKDWGELIIVREMMIKIDCR